MSQIAAFIFIALVPSLAWLGLKSFDAFRAMREAELKALLKAVHDAAFTEGVHHGMQRAIRITPDRPCEVCAERLWNEIDELTEGV